jgi:hypothetical protein
MCGPWVCLWQPAKLEGLVVDAPTAVVLDRKTRKLVFTSH